MKIITDYAKLKETIAEGVYDIVPVAAEILSDFITPIEALKVLKNNSTHAYMLESAQADEKWGRYTFLGYEPTMSISAENGVLSIGEQKIVTERPADHIRKLLASYRSPKIDHLPPFTGGLVGYFSYDYFALCEPAARTEAEDTENFKELDLMLFDKVIAFDHVCQKIILIVNMKVKDKEAGYEKALAEIKALANLLRTGERIIEKEGKFKLKIKFSIA